LKTSCYRRRAETAIAARFSVPLITIDNKAIDDGFETVAAKPRNRPHDTILLRRQIYEIVTKVVESAQPIAPVSIG
jgi:hypothetical protein